MSIHSDGSIDGDDSDAYSASQGTVDTALASDVSQVKGKKQYQVTI